MSIDRRDFIKSAGAVSFARGVSPQNDEARFFQWKVAAPVFTRGERDRRWSTVRRIMARPSWNLDALIAPAVGDSSYHRNRNRTPWPAPARPPFDYVGATASTTGLLRASLPRVAWAVRCGRSG